jgi:PKD repeat protein
MNMVIKNHLSRRTGGFAVLAAAMLLAGCSLDKQEAPPLSGPSELGLSLAMAASPDQVPRDGTSQSVVTITARDAQSRPIAGQRIGLTLAASAAEGAAISASEVVTDAAGHATFLVTAPVAGSTGDIFVSAVPVGTNAGNAASRVIEIDAMPRNGTVPQPAFTFSPTAPEINQTVTFDASTTQDEGVACSTCTFTWDFGGEGTATGMIVTHAFTAGGTYVVSLTAVDRSGSTKTLQQNVTVTAPSIPTSVSVSSSPATPIARQAATFTASATPAANHRIVSYEFTWGDGNSNTQPSALIQHTYSQSGSYLLTLTVRDDLGQSTTVNQVVTVTSGLTATFTTQKSGTTVTFDASASSSSVASTITDYAWDFDNDGTYDTNGSSPTVSNDFGANGTYRVTLRVTDNNGVTATFSQNVTLP